MRVSAAEKEAELAAFLKGVRFLGWGLVSGVMAVCVSLVMLFPAVDGATRERSLFGIAFVAFAIFMGLWRRLWKAPDRRFERRPQAGEVRSAQEVRAATLKSIGWGQLGAGTILALLLCARWADGERLYPAMGAALLVVIAVQAVRKLLSGGPAL